MPPSETVAAPALFAAGDDNLPSNDNHASIPPNNHNPTKSVSNGEDNDVMGGKHGGSMAAAADEPVAKNLAVQDSLHPSSNNKISENNKDTPSSSPRRRVKKQRSDDFVYEDTKKDEKQISEKGAKKPPPAKKPPRRKRPQLCPSSDSILIEVPLSVTADLGVALKRTRRKRIKRIQDWVSSAPGKKQKGDNNKAAVKKKSDPPTNDKNGKGGGDSCSDSDDLDNDGDKSEKDITLDYDDDALGKTPKRNQYVSVVDYLEAKYVRGVMIADYDDREQAKIQSNDVQEEPDSEGDNSCYDDEDGFIDDSLIVEDVAGQVMASSTYGLTQIEEEARRRKKERKRESDLDVDTEQPTLEGLGITDEKLDDTNLDEGMESDFDDGFFVNLGDLKMAEGWSGDNVVISPTKKKRTKKRIKAAAKDDNKPTTKKTLLPSSPQKKKKPDDTKQKTDSKATSQKKGKKTLSGKSEDKQPKKKDQVVKHPKKMSPEKERATQLRKLMKRKYNICVKMIKDLTTDHLPLKQRNKKTVKLSVNIPPDKTVGDEITFANPNIPGQKLKVQIPAKADMEKRTFVASVPGPKVPFTKKENNLPKEFKEALCDYATAYDDWCAAEETHNESLPENKRKDYKINAEKMKKFDEMVTEFPKKLATPIDTAYLRAAVRRVRNNKARQEKRKSETESPKRRTVMEKVEINITVPPKGNEFALLSFNAQDFQQ